MKRPPKYALKAIKMLESEGYSAFLVGGCVRDMLLDRDFSDIDIATSAPPEQTKRAFSEYECFFQGGAFGTIGVFFGENKVEITTFREEIGYSDKRHPDTVKFTDNLHADLERRDFTVNSLAYNPECGIVDDFGGVSDLENRILRATGDARTRFSEDALRILRMFRFSAQLGFCAEPDTLEAAIALSDNLRLIAVERVREELFKLLAFANCNYALSLMSENNVLDFIGVSEFDADEVSECPPQPLLRLAAMLTYCASAAETASLLKLSNSEARLLNAFYSAITGNGITDYCSFKSIYGRLLPREWKSAATAMHALGYPSMPYAEWSDRIERNAEPYKLSQLAVTGSDVTRLGYGGEIVGEILDFCLNEVLKDPLKNDSDVLRDMITKKFPVKR